MGLKCNLMASVHQATFFHSTLLQTLLAYPRPSTGRLARYYTNKMPFNSCYEFTLWYVILTNLATPVWSSSKVMCACLCFSLRADGENYDKVRPLLFITPDTTPLLLFPLLLSQTSQHGKGGGGGWDWMQLLLRRHRTGTYYYTV